MDELESNHASVALQLKLYLQMKQLMNKNAKMQVGIVDMKKHAQEEAQRIEKMIDNFEMKLQSQQVINDNLASHFFKSLSRREIQLYAPTFFHENTEHHKIDKGIYPFTLDEFRVKVPGQEGLYFNQNTLHHAVYKSSRL